MTNRVAPVDIQTEHCRIQAARLQHFRALPHDDQVTAIRKLALQGLTDRDLSVATGWPLDLVRNALGKVENQ